MVDGFPGTLADLGIVWSQGNQLRQGPGWVRWQRQTLVSAVARLQIMPVDHHNLSICQPGEIAHRAQAILSVNVSFRWLNCGRGSGRRERQWNHRAPIIPSVTSSATITRVLCRRTNLPVR
jgi:hypothetical protein